jgi:hypothetical protein
MLQKHDASKAKGEENESMKNNNNQVSFGIIAIVLALALLGVVMVLVANNLAIQEAEAGCERGRGVSQAFNASQGRCFRP